jgi:hypothetical protein
VNAARRHNPETLVRSQSEPSDQPFKARESGIGWGHTQAEKTFARHVVYAVCRSFHVAPLFLASTRQPGTLSRTFDLSQKTFYLYPTTKTPAANPTSKLRLRHQGR